MSDTDAAADRTAAPSIGGGAAPHAPVHGHPALMEGLREKVEALFPHHGPEDQARVVGSLARLATESGLQRVDHVVGSGAAVGHAAGTAVLVVQGRLDDPAHQRAQMPLAEAISTPVSDSLHRMQEAMGKISDAIRPAIDDVQAQQHLASHGGR